MNLIGFLGTVFISVLVGFNLSRIINLYRKRKDARKPQDKISALAQKDPEIKIKTPLEKRIEFEGIVAMLRQLSETLSYYASLNDLGKNIVETACKILNLEICVLLLLDNTTDELTATAGVGIDDKFVSEMRIKKEDEISGKVAKYNELTVINDWQKGTKLYNLKYDKCYKNNLVSLPLCAKGRILGVLNASHKKSDEIFSDEDIEVLKIIASESAIAIQNVKFYAELQENYLTTVIALANAIDAKDPYTHLHSKNVTRYAVRIAQELHLATPQIENIRHAGLLHDIGKIGVKDAILLKPEKLSDAEYIEIKKHPAIGEEITKSLPF